MAGLAATDWPVPFELPRGMAVTTQAEIVKPCFSADTQVGTRAAMTRIATAAARVIDEVVMAFNAFHLSVSLVREIDLQRSRARYDWLPQMNCRTALE
jgi:hypothetical protein